MIDLFEDKSLCMLVCTKEENNINLCKKIFNDMKDVYFIDNAKLEKFPYKLLTPKFMIQLELRKNKSKNTFVDILELFEVDDYQERFDRQWRYLGNNRWLCSAALGVAQGKKYFCLPWMYMSVMEYQEYRNNQILGAIKKINGKIFFPIEGVIKNRYIDDDDVCVKCFKEII